MVAFVKIILATIFMLLGLFILNSLFLNINLTFIKFINIFQLLSFIVLGVVTFFSFSYVLGIKKYFTSNSILNNNK